MSTSSLQFNESELISIYNNTPNAISAHVVEVDINSDSRFSQSSILFNKANNGDYWIIKTEDSQDWLFPKARMIVNEHAYVTLQIIFACQGYEQQGNRNFLVHKPAKVSLKSNGDVWMLEEKGKMEFGDVSPLLKLEFIIQQAREERDQLVTQIEKYRQVVEELETELRHISKEKENLQNQLINAETDKKTVYSLSLKLQQDNERTLRLLEAEKIKNEYLENQLQMLKYNSIKIANKFSGLTQELQESVHYYANSVQEYPKNETATSQLPVPPLPIPKYQDQEELVAIYNDNKLQSMYENLIAVSTEPTSIETSRTGSGKKPILTPQSPSKYWIVSISGNLYLVPKEDALNTNDMTSVEVLFECVGYKKDLSNPKDFQLVKAGKVSGGNEQWVLEEKGVLKYS